jgi:phosphoglycolate phosphatase
MSRRSLLEPIRGLPSAVTPTAFLDLDGPILDVSLRHYRVYADGVTRLGGAVVDRETYWSAKRNKTPDREILAQNGLREAADAYHAIKMELIESPSYLAHDRLQLGAADTLRRIAKRFRLVLVTLRHSELALSAQLDALGIRAGFSNVLSAPGDAGNRWETKRDLVARAGLVAGEGDFFAGDTETDILAGRALGITTVAVCNGIRDERYLRPLAPDWIIPSLANLTDTGFLE